MSSTSQRRLKPIQEHINNGNWKQALQLCEKYQKKGEKSDAFLTTRALVLANQPEQISQKQGKDALLQLCNKDPPITDEDTISLLDNALASLNIGESNTLRLWERAASAKPGDESLLERWMFRSIVEENWISSQKAAMMLRKSFPKERQYDFWVVLMCYHIHKDPRSDDQSRKIFGTMAYKMLEKAASQTPAGGDDKAEVTPGKAIYTAEELFLLVSVYMELNHLDEVLSLLQGESLGIKSRIFKRDPVLLQELLLSVLQRSRDYANAVKICCTLIGLSLDASDDSHVSEHNPWCENSNAWSTLMQATIKSNDQETVTKVQSLVEAYRQNHPDSRHAAVAYIMLLREMLLHGHDVGEVLLKTCKDVYTAYYDKPTCIPDIRDAVDALNAEALENFREFVVQFTDEKTTNDPLASTSAAQANRCEFIYTFKVSKSSERDLFINNICQSLHSSSDWIKGTTEPSASDINLLGAAVSSLIRMSNIGSDSVASSPVYLVYAYLVARTLLASSPTTYTLSLLSIRLSQILGLFSLALQNIQGLSIKSLQWDSFAHIVMNRISSLHPHNVRGLGSSDVTYLSPQSALYSALVVYKRAGDSKANAIMQGLNHQNYRNADQAVNFSQKLEESICRRIYYLDSQRIRRLTGSEGNSCQTYGPSSFDGRDFSVFPNYEAPHLPKLEERLRLGPLPKDTWVQVMLLCDRIYQVLIGGSADRSSAQGTELTVAQSIAEAQQSNMSLSTELTETERLSVNLQLTIGMAASDTLAKGLVPDENWDKIVSEILSKLEDVLRYGQEQCRVKPATRLVFSLNWEFFHWAYSILDTLKYVKAFISFVDSVKKLPSQATSRSKAASSSSSSPKKITLDAEQRTKLKDWSSKIETSIHDQAREMKNRLSRQGALEDMLDAVMNFENNNEVGGGIAKTLEDMIGMAEIETALGEMRDSWEEGLERVLSVRVSMK